MDNNLIYTRERRVSAALIDYDLKLSAAQAAVMLQDNFTECWEMLKMDGVTIKREYNDFWVFTKSRMRIHSRPSWMEDIIVSTFPINNAGLRTSANTVFKDKNGKVLITATQEACVLDCEKHRPVKLSAINFPTEGFPEAVNTEAFEKFAVEMTDENFVYEYMIRSQEIDMSYHLNNTQYVKLAMNAFTVEYLKAHEVTALEIHYTGETVEGNVVKIFRKDIEEENASYIKIMEGQRCVAELKVEF